MNTYTLNGIDKGTFGIIPSQHLPGSNLAITGAWDMPARLGKCFHDWGDSIEPYVRADEIRYGGRDIDFKGLVEAGSKNEALRKLYDFFAFINSLTGPVPLHSTEYGTWNVYVRQEITVEYIGGGWCTVDIPYREPLPDLSGTLPVNQPIYYPVDASGLLLDGAGSPIEVGIINYDGYGIDGITFKDLALIVLDLGGQFNRAEPRSAEVIAYSNEGYPIGKSGLREIQLQAIIVQPDYPAFQGVIKSLYALFKKPGLRYLTIEEDALRDFFVMHGFRITDVQVGYGVSGILTMTLSEVNVFTDWNILTDSKNNGIQTSIGNILIA